MREADLAIIGGGIVGLATAWSFVERFPGRSVVVLEKEHELALHQSGRNSGVIHSGIYYNTGSQKALTCRRGKRLLEDFCRAHGIAFETCGKIVVAIDESELGALERIRERALANGVACERVGRERLRELEPQAAGVAALHVPETGIADYVGVCARLAELVRKQGSTILTDAEVLHVDDDRGRIVLASRAGEVRARALVTAAGLQSDRVAELTGVERAARIVPFRGEYFELVPAARSLVRNLIYPVPDPSFPFLGVHFTRMIGGAVECGPNAVLAFAREGYTKTRFDAVDLHDTLGYPGFWKLARKHWRAGGGEMRRSISKSAFTRALQRLLPAIGAHQLVPAPAGVRAQALTPDGALVDDFLIQRRGRVVNVLNAPSPAATSSLAIGATIVEQVAEVLA